MGGWGVLSIPIVHHVYSSVGGYKTIYVTQDPAADRIQKALVSVANTAYKGGMGATFRGYLRYQLPAPTAPRPTLGPWQLPAAVALGNGRWYIKSFPMGTDHVGRPRACVHSMVVLPERISPPAWWQPQALAQVESAIVSSYDFPADALFLHGRDSLQGLRERTRDQYPWQPTETLNRAAGLAWLVAGNLPPALVGSMIKLLLYPGARLFLLATEEQALFLARQLECILPGSYRRFGGLLMGPHQRYIVPPLCPPNLVQLARPTEYTPGECLVDLSAAPPRWVGPEPPTSPLAAMVLDYLNRRDLAGLLHFIEMWDLLDELAPTPARQTGGLAAMTSLQLLTVETAVQPLPDWTKNPAACASALPFLIQAGWFTAHDAAWQSVRTALAGHTGAAAGQEIALWDGYVAQVRQRPNLAPPPPPAIRGIIKALEAPSHSTIIAAIDDAMLDDSWMDDSSHKIPTIQPTDPQIGDSDIPEEFAIAPEDAPDPDAHDSSAADLPTARPADSSSEITLLPGSDTGIEPATMEIDAEFALPEIAPPPPAAPNDDEAIPSELETVAEDWEPQARAQAALSERAQEPPRKKPVSATPPAGKPHISSALESAAGEPLAPSIPLPPQSTPESTPPKSAAPNVADSTTIVPLIPANGETNDSSTVIGALEGDTRLEPAGTASSSVLLVAEEETPDPEPPPAKPKKSTGKPTKPQSGPQADKKP